MRRRTESKTKKRMSAEDRKKAILETTVSFISQFRTSPKPASFTTSNPKNNSLKRHSNTPIALTKSPLQSILASKA